ncbi:S-adenosyl-l-methionine hydroxide adenosyltransferase family protein [Promethearchaeum syntrophicum]|uniref:S-adenosyl-l-methionine hydroxide adenosyltransferase family protein n=1 Tax=Promethearchaeum syntrophicum TaxID=2594042 RepID=A0A5B9D5B6_9ARCH|nr:SAM-dependent chlorinase/fluorinase [Candidatus Prometheoarchaeum syntrophicum]QEE14308.1 Chlorinase [Candidatus Prometheoarchaeum syntrophicum]
MVIIGIITDFGERGHHYVAEMKGVGLQINPDVQIIDVAHSITPFSIIEAAFVLYKTYSTFPKNTIFVCVVDPGVGSNRDIVAIQTIDNYILIGPDNGIFSYFSNNNLIRFILKITESEFFYKPYSETIKMVEDHDEIYENPPSDSNISFPISSTFHGRDIMMPIAAHLSKGLEIFSIGTPKESVVILPDLEPKYSEKELNIKGMIQYIDDFGNIITNIPNDEFHLLTHNKFSKFRLKLLDKNYDIEFVSFFAENSPEKILLIEGSSNFLEICQNQRNTASKLNVIVGNVFQIKLMEE